MIKVETETVRHSPHKVTARARVEFYGDVVEETMALDCGEGSALCKLAERRGGHGRLERERGGLAKRALVKALHTAREKLVERSLTPELRAEALARRPKGTPISTELSALTAKHRELARAIDEAIPTEGRPARRPRP